jgi:hypothetical protein
MMICKSHLRFAIASIAVLATLVSVGGSVALAQDRATAVAVEDKEIRTAFVGHEAHTPGGAAVGVGPYEFRSDGSYFRQQDLVSAPVGRRYVIANGRICIGPGPGAPAGATANECYKVLRDGSQYFMQYTAGGIAPFAVTLHPIVEPAK